MSNRWGKLIVSEKLLRSPEELIRAMRALKVFPDCDKIQRRVSWGNPFEFDIYFTCEDLPELPNFTLVPEYLIKVTKSFNDKDIYELEKVE